MSRQSSGVPTKQISVLLAEDNDINVRLARAVLHMSGATVVHAHNGVEAVARAQEALTRARASLTRSRAALTGSEGFDLVLMDIHMPVMDGIEAARGIRALYPDKASPAAGRPPIVALTANALAEDRAAYLAAGLDDFLAKPFERQDLAHLIARWRPSAIPIRSSVA